VAAFRILVADDHEVVRKGLIALLEQQPEWQVCGEAGDGREAIEKAKKWMPDLIIMDLSMPGMNGLEATRQIVRANPATKVLILTLHDSEQVIPDVLDAGARGFILKSDPALDVVAGVEALRRGKTYFTSKVASIVLEGYLKRATGGTPGTMERHQLTPREREVVQLLAEGCSTKEVAVALGLCIKTAETHRSNIMRKLQLHSVSDLVLYAVRNNIIHVVQGAEGHEFAQGPALHWVAQLPEPGGPA
jgi:DNA-binding NarL/FixJ family response regulator